MSATNSPAPPTRRRGALRLGARRTGRGRAGRRGGGDHKTTGLRGRLQAGVQPQVDQLRGVVEHDGHVQRHDPSAGP